MITLIFIAVFASVGFQFAMEPDMILAFYKRFLFKVNKINHWTWLIAKPLGFCITCNSHWVAFILIFTNHHGPFILKEFACIAVSGLSTLIWFGYNKIKDK
jgi:hypothetical protein